ncbi:MAG: hypothetical protein PHF46_02465 [Candidatus Gracilibacteria bacterium]|nr:hypothetical protein [Candidatus Gracilibacteria bacterium]MDD3120246.1 hypothetical protein [Candidatus Gracilibacteria bacterium]MDD4530152.1 hypothetical protein [Candidatus Gracilibacteria bacterium]
MFDFFKNLFNNKQQDTNLQNTVDFNNIKNSDTTSSCEFASCDCSVASEADSCSDSCDSGSCDCGCSCD